MNECCVQVPCYVFDTDGKKHDLSPLVKVSDGFLVDDGDDSIDFYINICRSLSELGNTRRDDGIFSFLHIFSFEFLFWKPFLSIVFIFQTCLVNPVQKVLQPA